MTHLDDSVQDALQAVMLVQLLVFRPLKGVPRKEHGVEHDTRRPDVGCLAIVAPHILNHLCGWQRQQTAQGTSASVCAAGVREEP